MKTLNAVLAGFGGQGILFAGKVIAYCGLVEERQVSWLPSYGPEMRGGTANCSVCLADEPIGSPLVVQPDVLIAMNNPSYDKFIDAVRPGGIAIVDSTLIDRKCDREDIAVHYVPATRLADEQKLKGLANIILIGKMLAETEFASADAVEKAIAKCVPPSKQHLIDANLRAIELGKNQ